MNYITFIDGIYRTEITVKKSRFICSIKGDVNKEEAENFIQSIKKEFPDARHNCFAYLIDDNTFRFSDDGEPQGTAGIPILDILRKRKISETVVVVTRYFGGILLGAPGLVSAYTDAIIKAISEAKIGTKKSMSFFEITAGYQENAQIDNISLKKGYKKYSTSYEDVVKSVYIIDLNKQTAFMQDVTESSKGKALINKIKEEFVKIPSEEIK